ncbi:MAG: hypothetical protein COA96_11780 [SAR86 cluster bacterium]|uniref:DUF5916 domain-containing protein n=1 Tax=SAR86 cluster bacterium TaxID=2030880 RepID=A0A2A5AVT5_9GAMM|nr:MAG: hypothetical protein COA96_11780 [SAR86 cluster bacterium]
MRKSWLMLCALCTVVTFLFSNSVFAADEGLIMPLIEGEPSFADFNNMSPSSVLARSMAKVENFVQRNPDDGDPATQRTEVYVGYDHEKLHVIFLAFDSNPNQIRANLSSRENIDGDDNVEITIDTFNDQRAAFSFRSTPLGIQWDARWTEGSSRRAGFDTTLEAVWDSEGQLTDQGYMVKMAIPLRSLRFPDSTEQLWRIQFGRYVPRLSEESFWPPYSIAVEGRLNQTAMLTGIRDVSPGNNSQIIPFIFAREVDAIDTGATGGPRFRQSSEQDVGLDAKFIFNDSMVLDITLNPDFSQVESDEPQVTLNERFEVQFPERRPFFVENADFFATDSNLVFTRRIVDPEGGARFTGRAGNFGFGTILINDEAPGLNRAANDPLNGEKANIAILRGFMDISEQDRVGVLLTDRELGDGYNRVASLDGRFKLTDNWTTQVQLVGTESEPAAGGKTTTGYQRNIQINRAGRMFSNHTHFIETTSDFRTELGFQSRFFRPDTSGIHQRPGLTFYPENSVINSWNTTVMAVYLEDVGGDKIYTQVGPSLNVRLDTSNFGLSFTDFSEILRPKDFSGLASNRVYKYDNWQVSYGNSTLNTLSFDVSYRTGTTLNLVPPAGFLPTVADMTRFDLDMLWRPIDRLRISNTYLHTELESRSGSSKIFSNKIIRSNWNYQFTREWSLRFIAQYDETDAGPGSRLVDDENLNFDLLLRYVINPWSAFYVGYNSNQSNFDIVEMEGERELVIANDLRKDGDQIFVKFSYLFQR